MRKQIILGVLGTALAVSACHRNARGDGPMEEAGEKVDSTAEKTADKVEQGVETAGDKVEDATDRK